MDTFNIYMDEVPAGMDLNGEQAIDIAFRVVADSDDEGTPETDAVLANLDLFDLINLRDSLQDMIDEIALFVFDVEDEVEEEGSGDSGDSPA